MKFKRNSTLKKHYNKHKKVKPYICCFPNCNKTFIEKGNLKTHFRIHVYYFLIKKKDKLVINQQNQFSIQTDVSEYKKSNLKPQNNQLKIQQEVQFEIYKDKSSTSILGKERSNLLVIVDKLKNSFNIIDEKIEKYSKMILLTLPYNYQENHLISTRNYLCNLKEKFFSIYSFINQAANIVDDYNFELENSFSDAVKILDRLFSKIHNLF
jgi:hypothetical protein